MEQLKEIRQNKNFGNVLLFTVIAAGYLFFLTSRIWLSDAGELIGPTPFYEKQILEKYSVYLTKWDYAEKQDEMEIVVEVETNDLLAVGLKCKVLERTFGELDAEVVLGDTDYMVIRIQNVPKKWKEISLHLEDENKKTVNLYTNRLKVDQVKALKSKDRTGYQCDRLKGQIGYDAYQIRQKESEISRLTEENSRLSKRVEELNNGRYPTQKEADDAADIMETAKSRIESNGKTIEKRQEEISELNTRSEELEKQIRELKGEKGGMDQ